MFFCFAVLFVCLLCLFCWFVCLFILCLSVLFAHVCLCVWMCGLYDACIEYRACDDDAVFLIRVERERVYKPIVER